jgi:hypothetical protein
MRQTVDQLRWSEKSFATPGSNGFGTADDDTVQAYREELDRINICALLRLPNSRHAPGRCPWQCFIGAHHLADRFDPWFISSREFLRDCIR